VKIEVASSCGFCSGVKRAINFAFSSAEKEKEVYTLGPLIHNRDVVAELEKRGVKVVNSVDDVESGTIVVRSHGVSPEIYRRCKEKRLKMVDGTCPTVARVQQLAKSLEEEGYLVVIVGDPNHPEVEGIKGWARSAYVAETERDIEGLKGRIGIIAQTTQTIANLQAVVAKVMEEADEVKVYNTICKAVMKLQKSTMFLAKRSDAVLVIGGKNSANTKRLYLIASSVNSNTHYIEREDEIDPKWFFGKESIGITAGTSTPPWVIEKVINRIEKIGGERW
jgi:4-hydroxy-3-methylbut-2-enyl diphosphate reductase